MNSPKPSNEQLEYILRHKSSKTARQIAKEVGLPRKLVEEKLSGVADTGAFKAFPGLSKYSVWLSVLLVFVVTFLVFSNTLRHDFVWDDWQFVLQDKTLESIQELPRAIVKPLGYYGNENAQERGSLWRPIVTLTFFIDTALWGKSRPWGYHLTNVLAHSLVASLFFLFLRRYLRSHWLCLLGALFYALHPAQSEAIASINGRSTPLSGLFILLAFLAYPKRTWLSGVLFLAAVYCKETALPFVALIFISYFIEKDKSGFSIKEVVNKLMPYLLATGIYFGTRFMVLGGLGSAARSETLLSEYFSWPNRFIAQPLYFFEYFKIIFLPFNLHPQRQVYFPSNLFGIDYLIPFALFMLLALAMYYSFKAHKRSFFCLAWFTLFLVPVLNFFVIINGNVMEHWLYLPLMGFSLLVFSWIDPLIREKNGLTRWVWYAFIPILFGYALLTYQQNKVWKDNITLFEYTCRHVQDPMIYNELGVAYAEKGMREKADKAFAIALKLSPDYKDAQYNRVLVEKMSFAPHNSSTSVEESAYSDMSMAELVETFMDIMDRLDVDQIPGLKEEVVDGNTQYSFSGKSIKLLEKSELINLLLRCDSLLTQMAVDEENARRNSMPVRR